MELSSLSSVSVEKLKCSNCSNFLSFFPVRAFAENVNICGRCPVPQDKQCVENVAFQTLAQFMRFPCRYKDLGCEEEKLPKEVPSHETSCRFKTIPCPLAMIYGCNWFGPRPKISDHCRSDHQQWYYNGGDLTLDLSQTSLKHYLLEHDGLLLIFRLSYDVEGKFLNFEISTSEFETNPKSYSCHLQIKNDQNSVAIDFVSTSFEEVAPTPLSLDCFTKQVTLQVTIGNVVIDPDECLDVEMLKILTCYFCQNYAIPPIYNCAANSETLCSSCKKTHKNSCTPCLENINSRNISLDKMASLLNYPCRNRDNGCLVISKAEQIKRHHKICELRAFECPFAPFSKCDWKGVLKDFSSHVQGSHQLLENSSQMHKKFIPDQTTCDMVKYSGRFFRLVCLHSKDKYFWSVQAVGNCDDFKYEIEILDPVKNGKRLLVRQQCERLTEKDDIFKEGKKFSYFFWNQIRDFVSDQIVKFKVHIFV